MEITMRITEKQLKKWLVDLEESPTDLDLINKVALGYMNNPDMCSEQEDLDFFEKAYKLKKTIKSSHNLAWQLYFEYGSEERALKIQEECMSLEPCSSIPYHFYAYMLLSKSRYKEALHNLEIAYSKNHSRSINNNMGVANFGLGHYEKAVIQFEQSISSEDVDRISLYNYLVTLYHLGLIKYLKMTLSGQNPHFNSELLEDLCGYELSEIYLAVEDFENAKKMVLKAGIDGFSIEWETIAYVLFLYDEKLFDKKVKEEITNKLEWIQEIDNNDEDWQDCTLEEKAECKTDYTNEIVSLQKMKTEFKQSKPSITLEARAEYCGCLMFDCQQHGIQENDTL